MFNTDLGFLTRPLNLTHAGLGFFDMNESEEVVVYQYNWSPEGGFGIFDFFVP